MDAAQQPTIEASGLVKRYGDFVAVAGLSFTVSAGEVVGFLGPNGAGKTTTMRILAGALPASDGGARITGHDIFRAPREARRAIGYLPENPPLYPEMDVQGYLAYVADLKDVPRAERATAVERAIARCGLAGEERRAIGTLSKGYRQRVGLAQAIVHEPRVLILDEPTAGLDPIQVREIRRLIEGLAAPGAGADGGAGVTIVLSTHILAEVEAICRRVILIHRGRKVLDQPLSEITREGKQLESIFVQITLREEEAAAALAAEASLA